MKNRLRVILLCLIVILAVLSFASCENVSDTGVSSVDTCIVSYENTGLSNQSVAKGSSLQKPSDPDKADCVFVGWYTDADFTNEAKFPITVDSDVKIYARFYTCEEAFREARKNTVGADIPGFEYTYTMDVSASYLGFSLSGNTEGSVKYSSVGDVSYYDESVNSGALLYDRSNYKICRGSSLQKISLDENGKMISFSADQVIPGYKYDSSSFAKAIFTYSDNQLGSVSSTGKSGVYKLNSSMSFSSVIALIADNINNPVVEKMLGDLPETSADTALYVTFDGDQIGTYTYEFKVSVSELQFELKYSLNFIDVGVAESITPRSFEKVALSPEDIEDLKNEVDLVVDEFKNRESSGYDFSAKTGVDFGLTTGEINSTFAGTAYRKLENESVYFHNDIEIDSDYKNKDLYKDKGIEDVHVKLTKLSNGEVHLIEKKLLIDATQKVENFTDSEMTSFYLFDILANSGEYSFAQKEVLGDTVIYTFGLTNDGVAILLAWLNGSLDLDPLGKASVDALVYGNFDASSVLLNSGTISVKLRNEALEEISVKAEGDFKTSFAESADFTTTNNAQVKLDMKIEVKADGNSFEPFDSVKDAK